MYEIQKLPYDHHRPQRVLCQPTCLRKNSSFTCDNASCSSRLDELSTTTMVTVKYSTVIKKSLSYADQHGQNLVVMRTFYPKDAPVCFCDVPVDINVTRKRNESFVNWIDVNVVRQHLLSMGVMSLLGCVLLGLRKLTK
ncbi:hypothetical protein Plhal304r1_c059g0147561 [Plasmopara halstedii]